MLVFTILGLPEAHPAVGVGCGQGQTRDRPPVYAPPCGPLCTSNPTKRSRASRASWPVAPGPTLHLGPPSRPQPVRASQLALRCVCVCVRARVCVCVCVCGGGRGYTRGMPNTDRPQCHPCRVALTPQLHPPPPFGAWESKNKCLRRPQGPLERLCRPQLVNWAYRHGPMATWTNRQRDRRANVRTERVNGVARHIVAMK